VYVPRALPKDLELTLEVFRFLFWKRVVLGGWRVL
jgi:hypothetical protein